MKPNYRTMYKSVIYPWRMAIEEYFGESEKERDPLFEDIIGPYIRDRKWSADR